MKLRIVLILFPLLLPILSGCAGVEEARPREMPRPETPGAPEPQVEPESKEEEKAPEPSAEKRAPLVSLLPEGMRLVTEEGVPAIRRGDFDSDGNVDEAYLAVTGSPVALSLLGAKERLYQQEGAGSRDSRLLLRLASGEDLLLNTGRFLLLAEFSSLPITPGGEDGESQPEALVYLRFEERERQRHLLFSVSPIYKAPHRYLFVTDSATGFSVRDVDGDGEREVVHMETTVSAGGFEESFYTLYQFRQRELVRRARVPVVERTNQLFQEIRRLLIAGEREELLRRYTKNGDIDIYFEPKEARRISKVLGVEFVHVPELRSNPFNLAQDSPELRTEILLLAQGEQQLYGVRVGVLIEPGGRPELKLLPAAESD